MGGKLDFYLTPVSTVPVQFLLLRENLDVILSHLLNNQKFTDSQKIIFRKNHFWDVFQLYWVVKLFLLGGFEKLELPTA